ncbi:MAG: 2-dehydro-3-deoxyglucarate aldolase [Rubrivivax sp.]|nr:2-dehydro-3-deoxyglucarate aldolase [Rubrivivax sp.]
MNPFRQLLKRAGNQPPLGTWLLSASPLLAEAAGHAGFDWGVIDMEHGPLDMGDVVHLLQAVAGTRLVPVVRVPWNDTVAIKRVLDAGATTLLVPFVQDADEAAAAVAATRYPPQGVRGMAGMSRAAHFGLKPDYLATANRGMAVIVQIETESALAQLEAIGGTEGVDAVFIGPADLSGSMGIAGQVTHPRVMAAMRDAARRCHAIGKPIGTIGVEPEVVAQYRAAGYDFLAVNSDLGLFVQASVAAMQALRAKASDHVHDLTGGTHTRPA